jgi:hypothetical protein
MATEREYLISLNLAKPGRGRYSAEATAVLNKAKADGMTFDKTALQIAKETRKEKPVREKKVVVKENRPSQTSYSAKVVRAWAEKQNLMEKGMRGKLPTKVINAYLAKNEPIRRVSAKAPVVREKIRTESVGWTFGKRGPKDAAYISEPLIAVTSCGSCTRGVSFCKCSSGPVAPKYLGGELLLLTRPAK